MSARLSWIFLACGLENCLVGINPGEEETVPITIERGNLPEDVEAEAPVYTEHGSDKGSITPPSIGENWTGTVSVTFTYAPEKYEEKTKNLPNEYTYSGPRGWYCNDYPQLCRNKIRNDKCVCDCYS